MIKTPRSLLLRIWREHLSLYSGQLFLALTFMGALAAAEVGFILATEWIFAGLEPERSTRFQSVTPQQVVVFGPIFVIGLAILQAFFFYLQAITAQGVGVSVLRDLQVRMYSAITAYDLSQLKGRGGEGDSRLGGLVSRFTNDMTVLRESLRRVPNAARDVIRLIGFISVLAFLDPILFGCVLLIYPLIGFPITIIGKAIRRLARRVQGQIGDVTGLLTESLSGQEMIKSYRLEDHETERLAEAFDERRRLLMRLVRLRSANEPIITIIAAVAVAFIIAVAALRIEAGSLTGPELVAFLVAMALLSQPARGLGTLNAVLQEGLAAIERVFGVIDDEPRIIDPSEPKALGITVGSAPAIAFEGVDFAYEEDAPILKDFSLHIPRGSTVALVGPSGAGKSTVFGLLPRFYDRASGTITIEGTGIEQVSLDDLRRSISVVSQTPILFDVSVKENIRLGQLDASDADIEAAAKAAAAHAFIMRLPGGYDARVGESGGALSGGERQRIALARAFLKNAPILLLDEATSALDAESEQLIEEAMRRLRQGRTTLIIAHRLSTIREADIIAVMQSGEVIEHGTHQELLDHGGLYARLVALQDGHKETV